MLVRDKLRPKDCWASSYLEVASIVKSNSYWSVSNNNMPRLVAVWEAHNLILS